MSQEKAEARIEKRGAQYCVVSKSGKSLGCYPTREAALKRLRQVEFFKQQGAVEGHIVAREAPNMVKYDGLEKTISSEEAQSLIDKFSL